VRDHHCMPGSRAFEWGRLVRSNPGVGHLHYGCGSSSAFTGPRRIFQHGVPNLALRHPAASRLITLACMQSAQRRIGFYSSHPEPTCPSTANRLL